MSALCNVGLDPKLTSPPSRIFKSSTVLTRSISVGALRQTKFLLQQGCNPNLLVGHQGMRPLMVACFIADERKRRAILKALLEHGADPTLTDVQGRNSVMYGCALGLKGVTELLVKDCDYDLNATDKYGDTILHVCAKAGGPKVLGVVLKEMQRHRLNISIQNNDYLTPLSLAILNGNYECAKAIHGLGGSPRFSRTNFAHIVSLLCSQHKHISSIAMRAISDAASVGRAFDARKYFLESADVIKMRRAENESSVTELEDKLNATSVCEIENQDSNTVKLPQLFLPVCSNISGMTSCTWTPTS